MSRRLPFLLAAAVLSLCASGALVACGGKGAASGDGARAAAADTDPLVLLPGSAIFVASLDVHAMYANASVGSAIASFTDSLVPLGPDSGFDASRDVDHLVLGGYAGDQADVAVVLSGRFDVDKMAAVTRTKSGASVRQGHVRRVRDRHRGSHHDCAADGQDARRGDERSRAARPRPPRPGRARARDASVGRGDPRNAGRAVRGRRGLRDAADRLRRDRLDQPGLAQGAAGTCARIGNFDDPGVNVAATLTYGDPTGAQGATDGIHLIDSWQKILAPLLLGAKLQNLQVGNSGNDVSCKFAVDSTSLRALLTLASRYFKPPTP